LENGENLPPWHLPVFFTFYSIGLKTGGTILRNIGTPGIGLKTPFRKALDGGLF